MKTEHKVLAACIGIPLAVGGLSAWLTREGMKAFEQVKQPPLSPPGWLFPVVWTLLFTLMGVASYLVLSADAPQSMKTRALGIYGVQLVFNFVWTIVFFNAQWFLFAFLWLVALWLLILATAVQFFRIRRAAGWLLVPYLLWVGFAGYLNYGVWVLQKMPA